MVRQAHHERVLQLYQQLFKSLCITQNKATLWKSSGIGIRKTLLKKIDDIILQVSVLCQNNHRGIVDLFKRESSVFFVGIGILLDLGLELCLPIEKKILRPGSGTKGNTVFIVQTNALVACFDDDIDFKTCAEQGQSIMDEIADLQPLKVAFKDAGFKDDKDRINVEERFKRLSPETRITVL
jgi:adenine-specific DNA-methyltransferase